MPDDLNVPIRIVDSHRLRRGPSPIRVGVPFPKGLVCLGDQLCLCDAHGVALPHQGRALANWPDGSVRWLLLDAVVLVRGEGETVIFLRRATETKASPKVAGPVEVEHTRGGILVRTGAMQCSSQLGNRNLLQLSTKLGTSCLASSISVHMVASDAAVLHAEFDHLDVEERGPIVATVFGQGRFVGTTRPCPLRFESRMRFVANTSMIQFDFTVWNPRPAVHAGGLWDLGDPNSYLFRDLSIAVDSPGPIRQICWYDEDSQNTRAWGQAGWTHYQDSSGGDRWDSANHLDRNRRSTVTFRGYECRAAAEGPPLSKGDRATPGVVAETDDGWFGVALKDYWECFPKALRWREGQIQAALFPSESVSGFELQGGEQKRHTAFVEHGLHEGVSRLGEWQHPVDAMVDPFWIQDSRVLDWFTAAQDDDDPRRARYVAQIVEGSTSFAARREIIDEYGWRNFGDLYADHEAVGQIGADPFISHYNNQYDFVLGAFLQGCRTGRPAWHRLMAEAARHVIDIDLYRTAGDKAAFNGGQFWHTDHYRPAATCTHRTYSRANGRSGYGGGPSDEHNYSSGLLCYYYATGDPEGARAVAMLADWVCSMDDGAATVLALLDAGPTGHASASRDESYHGPGRGAGNSINTLMDAYAVTGNFHYWRKAEELIQRCVHPHDDIAARQLDDPENRWSYLVFFQVLGKYLSQKIEREERDFAFWYARDSLLHYSRWMLEHEEPYKDVLDKVEIPTETWPAHDIRKCHVLYLASLCTADLAEQTAFRDRAAFFYGRSLEDLLSFDTAALTRPLVIWCVFGTVYEYFRRTTPDRSFAGHHSFMFGDPIAFLPQRARIRSTVLARWRVMRAEVARLLRQRTTPFFTR